MLIFSARKNGINSIRILITSRPDAYLQQKNRDIPRKYMYTNHFKQRNNEIGKIILCMLQCYLNKRIGSLNESTEQKSGSRKGSLAADEVQFFIDLFQSLHQSELSGLPLAANTTHVVTGCPRGRPAAGGSTSSGIGKRTYRTQMQQ